MNYAVRTIIYFLAWGVFYGVLLGSYTGTALFPLLGTSYGMILGLMGGVGAGLIAGLAALVFRAAQFDMDTNLELHRRRVARQIGLAVVLVPILVCIVGSIFSRGFFGSGLFLVLGLPWAGLASAYAARRYPDVIARHMLKGKRGQRAEYEESFTPQSLSLWNNIRALGRRGAKLRRLIGVGSLALFQIYNLIVIGGPRYLLLTNILLVAVMGVIGVLVAEVLWAYVVLGNGVLMTFLKRVILGDIFAHMSPVRSRRILTGTAFVFTLMVSWWTFVFAPLIASLTAYHVYHTLALPDESPEKAKRKEKNVLALEDEIDEEGEMLMEDSATHEEATRLDTEERQVS